VKGGAKRGPKKRIDYGPAAQAMVPLTLSGMSERKAAEKIVKGGGVIGANSPNAAISGLRAFYGRHRHELVAAYRRQQQRRPITWAEAKRIAQEVGGQPDPKANFMPKLLAAGDMLSPETIAGLRDIAKLGSLSPEEIAKARSIGADCHAGDEDVRRFKEALKEELKRVKPTGFL
jgi:hypothetical protein